MRRDWFVSVNWNKNVEVNAPVILVFQGGGIRGIDFLGHLQSFSKNNSISSGLAGTSAGAIVAAGVWSGLLPDNFQRFLERKSYFLLGLIPSMFSFKDFIEILVSYSILFFLFFLNSLVGLILYVVILILRVFFLIPIPFFRTLRQRVRDFRIEPAYKARIHPGCSGLKFRNLIGEMISEGLVFRGFTRDFVYDFTGKDMCDLTFREILDMSGYIRFVRSINGLNDPDIQILRETYDDFDTKVNENNFIVFEKNGESINNILDLIYGEGFAIDPFFPSLFLSTANIDSLTPEIVNNIQSEYFDIPIADAVRASAGHPLIFKPMKLKIANNEAYYTDGGLISNFPAVYVSKIARKIAIKTEIEDGMYQDCIPFLFNLHVICGLCIETDRKNKGYVSNLMYLYFGHGKNIIEIQTTQSDSLSRVIVQPVFNRPHYLRFDRINRNYITKVTQEAFEFMQSSKFSNIGFYRNDERAYILSEMENIVDIFSRSAPSNFRYIRSHFYLLDSRSEGLLKKKAYVCFNSVSDKFFLDIDDSFRRRYAGIVGRFIIHKRPIYTKFELLQEMRRNNTSKCYFGLKYEETRNIPNDMNFCCSFPIFSIESVRYQRGATSLVPMASSSEVPYVSFDTGISGMCIGVLSVDGCADPVPSSHVDIREWFVNSNLVETVERRIMDISAVSSKALARSIRGMQNDGN